MPTASKPGDFDLDQIEICVRQSYAKHSPMREWRVDLIRELTGVHYGDRSDKEKRDRKVALNLIELYLNTLNRLLAPNNPAVLVTTKARSLRPVAYSYELWLNERLADMRFDRTLTRLVRDALIGIGLAKIGLAIDDSDVESTTGQVYVSAVDLDDIVFDTTARRWEELQFIGNRYTVPLDAAQEFDLFDAKERRKLDATRNRQLNPDGSERAANISTGGAHQDELVDMVDLLDLWLPGDEVVLTLPWEDMDSVLRVMDWKGPRHGPYQPLIFTEVPDNIFPLPPAMALYDLHQAGNHMLRKALRQAERQKKLTVYPGAGEDDMRRISAASDGEAVRLDAGAQEPHEKMMGGADQTNIFLANWVKELFNYFGGNLDQIGGLAPTSPTATQDQMLMASASKRIADMQDKVIDFARRVITDVAWYRWQERGRVDYVVKRAGQFELTESFGPEMPGQWEDFDFQVEPYSMQHHTPGERLMLLQQATGQLLPLVAQFGPQQGRSIDLNALVALYAKYANLPELEDVLTTTAPLQAAVEEQRKSPQTRRVYERVNRPSGQRPGGLPTALQGLMGNQGGNLPRVGAARG